MRFKIQKVEVIKHRKTQKRPCNENWMKDDEKIMREKIKNVGCKPPQWKISSDYKLCSSKEQMEAFVEFDVTRYEPPCQNIEKIMYAYEEFEILDTWSDGFANLIDLFEANLFEVVLEFQDGTYMEIQQVRDYSVQDAVGDIGGYLGLFLGFALVQIPELLLTMYSWIEAYFLKI